MSNRRTFIKATVLSAAVASIGMASFAAGSRHHQGRYPAFAVRYHGHFRNGAQGNCADDHRRNQQVRRRLGKKLEPVVVDPASNWPLFAEKARQLLTKDKVDVAFGCWTSVSRKSVLPVFKELNGLLFYPVQYEGEELEKISSTPAPRRTSRRSRPWNT